MNDNNLDDRERAFENKFRQDEETRFKIRVTAVRLMAMWVCSQTGLKGEAEEAYVDKFVESDIQFKDIDGIVKKAQRDLRAKGIDVSPQKLLVKFNSFTEQAKKALV